MKYATDVPRVSISKVTFALPLRPNNKSFDALLSKKDIEKAFDELDKHTKEEREYNCGKCGYDSCMDMAKAMAKGEVDKGNCYQYVLKILEKVGNGIEQNVKIVKENIIKIGI